ncbi:LytTR family two component transcriptional regulator [Leeuwenhoekiella aestuarii]|uniref:LytTR family two component transcriptional regulator n=1 Tax=Leeuwenhoekiella aestuarii TaxID=2249426 RepID=A0A4Q0NWZ4_9FLAO|nr:LytTR family DNA-binding domain-containing protein [Leeuwenhoekiella aestuarii]RXG16052.1 LytTR family two component transcriptional regulator [Leeuwenhoekiella aestuarii]RXG16746.1 LytTR family two component transcriptional regulator [Leeuwenhoekiella aestuarii]
MIRAIAIDDEPKAISIIRHHTASISDLKLIDTFTNPEKALHFLNTNAVDLIFLDINMPKLSGMNLLNQLEVEPLVIITSAYSQFALESYSFKTVDYLLKPFELERFEKAVSKVKERLATNSVSTSLFLKDGYQSVRVNTSEIQYIKSDGNYLDVYLNDRKISPRMTFSEILKLLPDNFMRVHNSYVVNLSKVDKLSTDTISISEKTIPVSTSKRELLSNKLNLKNISHGL